MKMKMPLPYYIVRVYDEDKRIVETIVDDDYEFIREVFSYRCMEIRENWERGNVDIVKVTKGTLGLTKKKVIERFK